MNLGFGYELELQKRDFVIMGPESVVLDQLGFNERFHNLGFLLGLNSSLLNWV